MTSDAVFRPAPAVNAYPSSQTSRGAPSVWITSTQVWKYSGCSLRTDNVSATCTLPDGSTLAQYIPLLCHLSAQIKSISAVFELIFFSAHYIDQLHRWFYMERVIHFCLNSKQLLCQDLRRLIAPGDGKAQGKRRPVELLSVSWWSK